VRLFDSEPISFRCGCSRERVENLLRGLGAEECQAILAEQGEVSVSCEFCNARYRFDAVDVERVFAASGSPATPSTRH
jgi:molecular chaperone Hsp33